MSLRLLPRYLRRVHKSFLQAPRLNRCPILSFVTHNLYSTGNFTRTSTIAELQDAFRVPSSPYYLAPGEQGPASPDEVLGQAVVGEPLPQPSAFATPKPSSHPIGPEDVLTASEKLIKRGYHAGSIWEQKIVWGDHDSFQHVNNVRYARFFESGRIQWIVAVGNELGGPAKAEAFIRGQGISFILKSLKIDFKRPVTFPDTLLIGHRITNSNGSRTEFNLEAVAYSLAQRVIVARSDSAIVWYDYDRLRKCDPGDEAWDILNKLNG